jgi:hypothetical protein
MFSALPCRILLYCPTLMFSASLCRILPLLSLSAEAVLEAVLLLPYPIFHYFLLIQKVIEQPVRLPSAQAGYFPARIAVDPLRGFQMIHHLLLVFIPNTRNHVRGLIYSLLHPRRVGLLTGNSLIHFCRSCLTLSFLLSFLPSRMYFPRGRRPKTAFFLPALNVYFKIKKPPLPKGRVVHLFDYQGDFLLLCQARKSSLVILSFPT